MEHNFIKDKTVSATQTNPWTVQGASDAFLNSLHSEQKCVAEYASRYTIFSSVEKTCDYVFGAPYV